MQGFTLGSLAAITDVKKKNFGVKMKKRTNGPVNAHLRSAAYTNKHV